MSGSGRARKSGPTRARSGLPPRLDGLNGASGRSQHQRQAPHDAQQPPQPTAQPTPQLSPKPIPKPIAPKPTPTTSAATASAANANPASAASAASAATAASAAAAAAGFVYQALKSGVLLVEDVERRQADVGHFLFTEDDFVTRCHVRCLWSVRCRYGGCRGASDQRKSQPDSPQSRYRFRHTLSLRSLLHCRHSRTSILKEKPFECRRILGFANLPCKVARSVDVSPCPISCS